MDLNFISHGSLFISENEPSKTDLYSNNNFKRLDLKNSERRLETKIGKPWAGVLMSVIACLGTILQSDWRLACLGSFSRNWCKSASDGSNLMRFVLGVFK